MIFDEHRWFFAGRAGAAIMTLASSKKDLRTESRVPGCYRVDTNLSYKNTHLDYQRKIIIHAMISQETGFYVLFLGKVAFF